VPVPLSDIVLWANLFVATGVVLTLAVSLIRFFRHGDEAEISFLKFKVAFRPNQRLVELQKAIDKLASEQRTLDADSRQKKNIMLFFGALLDELGVLLQVGNPADYRANRDRCFTFALSGLVGQLTKEPDNVHRAAIFLPGRDSTLLHLARGPQHNGRRRTAQLTVLSPALLGRRSAESTLLTFWRNNGSTCLTCRRTRVHNTAASHAHP